MACLKIVLISPAWIEILESTGAVKSDLFTPSSFTDLCDSFSDGGCERVKGGCEASMRWCTS